MGKEPVMITNAIVPTVCLFRIGRQAARAGMGIVDRQRFSVVGLKQTAGGDGATFYVMKGIQKKCAALMKNDGRSMGK